MTNIQAAANNNGTLNANSGTLSIDGGGTSSGDFAATVGATLNFGGGTQITDASSSFTGSGGWATAMNISFKANERRRISRSFFTELESQKSIVLNQ